MLHVSNNSISMTRGDTAKFTVPIKDQLNDQTYEIKATDKLKFTIKKKVTDETTLISKEVTGDNNFQLNPEDTNDLSYGKYVYDVQLTNEFGEVYTVIEPTTFELLSEVTW